MKICSINYCDNKNYSRGWCKKHYSRWYKTGTVVKKIIPTLKERLERNTISIPESGCCIWLGCLVYGYGTIRSNGKPVLVHRVSWELYRGAIPDGLCVLHKCDIKCCVNPDHLFLGTISDNNADRAKKGRSADRRGEKHPGVILTEKQVREIRASNGNQYDLAEQYGVSQPTISAIKVRRRWSHLI